MSLLSRLRNVFRADQVSDEIDREMAFHLAQRADELTAAGLTPEAAHAEARRRFGNPGVHKAQTRDRDVLLWMDTLFGDVRYAVRGLRAAPGFALVAILSLALGIGANTAIFTALNAILLRPLPSPDGGRLAYVRSGRDETFSYPLYERFHNQARSFEDVAAVERGAARHEITTIGARDAEATIVRAPVVTGSFFKVLGIPAALGRSLTSADDHADAPAAVVLSHAFWQRRFGSDSAILGTTIRLDSVPVTIVGVMPPHFVGFDAGVTADLWWPMNLAPRLGPDWAGRLKSSGVTWLIVFGRLADGVSIETAHSEISALFRRSLEESVNDPAWTAPERQRILTQTVALESGAAGYVRVRRMLKQPLFVVMAVVGLVLLVACANVAGLLLARGTERQREFAVRAALGGGRGRIVRQLLTESLVLALAGGSAGFFVARWVTVFLGRYVPQDEITLALEPDIRVVLFTGAVSLLTATVFGLVPALRLSRLDLATTIRNQGARSAGAAHRRLQSTLVVGQVALSMLLLAPAGLFARTLSNLREIDLGFQPDNLIAVSLDLSRHKPAAQEIDGVEHRIIEAIATMPGVQGVTITGAGMLSGNGYSAEFTVDGYSPSPGEELRAYAVLAGPHFFGTMRVPLMRGREFDATDEPPFQANGQRPKSTAVVLGETMAQRFFGRADPVGRQIALKGGERLTIVGVARDTKYGQNLRDGTPLEMYLPYFGSGVRMPPTLYVRANSALSLMDELRRAVLEADPHVSVRRVSTMDAMLDRALIRERLVAQLVGFFGAFGLLLASLGLYGLVSFGVTQRTREFGVRVAMGATVRDVLRLVLGQGFRLAVAGCALGVVAAVALTRVIASFLYGVSPADPLTLAAVASILLGVSLLACLVPARRAARIDASVAMRSE